MAVQVDGGAEEGGAGFGPEAQASADLEAEHRQAKLSACKLDGSHSCLRASFQPAELDSHIWTSTHSHRKVNKTSTTNFA